MIRRNKSATEDLDLRQPRVSSTTQEISQPIVISPEDATSIKSGNMTKEQGAQLLQKIIVQMEREKLKEAKKKDHEESLNISLQPISDDEFQDEEHEGKSERREPREEVPSSVNFHQGNEGNLPFNDKDERFAPKHLHPISDFGPPADFFPRDRFPGPQNWRGSRGGRRHWDNQTYPRGAFRPWRGHPNNWRNFQQREFGPGSVPEEIYPPNQEGSEQLTNGAVNLDEIKTITIDGYPKDIRFYDETGIVFINWDDPREISFMDDGIKRCVIFNDKDSCVLGLNEPYREVMIEGVNHKVKLGAPSREIYIDHVPYQCFFESPGIRIDLSGTSVHVRLEGERPQAKIGELKRTDLVAGKINLFINAVIIVPVYLDAKLQKFMIDGDTNTLKFVNALTTVLINDTAFDVEYGGLPKPCIIKGKKHFIRFSVLPKGVKPGRVKIKDMEGTQPLSPYNVDENSQDSATNDPVEPSNPAVDRIKKIGSDSPERNSNSPSIFQKLLEQQSSKWINLLSHIINCRLEFKTFIMKFIS